MAIEGYLEKGLELDLTQLFVHCRQFLRFWRHCLRNRCKFAHMNLKEGFQASCSLGLPARPHGYRHRKDRDEKSLEGQLSWSGPCSCLGAWFPGGRGVFASK